MPTKEAKSFSSAAPFKYYFPIWLILGLRTDGTKVLYGVPDVLITICVTICYPLHLVIGFMYTKNSKEFFSTLIMTMATVTCSLKHLCYRWNFPQMQRIVDDLSQLDKRIKQPADKEIFVRDTLAMAHNIFNIFSGLYISVVGTSLLSLITSKEWRLVYPGWLPFEWNATLRNYIAANSFQFTGLVIACMQNFSNDVYGPVCYCLYAGHVRQLRLRVSQIGYDPTKTQKENTRELLDAIRDFNALMRLFTNLRNTISLFMFVQIVSNALNIGFSVIFLTLFNEDSFKAAYYVLQLIAMLAEIFPCCYYGSIIELEFDDLPYDITTANWLEQSRMFRRNMLVFSAVASRKITSNAGGMISIHIRSFFSTCKMAYSMFTAILTMRSSSS